MSTLFECAIERHQDRLNVRSSHTSVGVTVLPDDDRRTDGALGKIVVEWDARLVEEGKEVAVINSSKRSSNRCRREAKLSVGKSGFCRPKRMASPTKRRSFLANSGHL